MKNDPNNYEKMSDQLAAKVSRFTEFERRFCEARSKGLSKTDAAKQAGSTAEGASLSRVGWNTEQKDGMEEYINFLTKRRADAALVDDTEIIDKLRRVYDEAIVAGKYGDANKAAELLANIAGLIGKGSSATNSAQSTANNGPSKNDTKAFQEDKEGMDSEDRMKKLKSLLNDTKD